MHQLRRPYFRFQNFNKVLTLLSVVLLWYMCIFVLSLAWCYWLNFNTFLTLLITNYYENTTKEQIFKSIESNVIVYNPDHYEVSILKDDSSDIVLFQIRFKQGFYLDLLLCLGLAKYSPSISVNGEGQLMVTFHIKKDQ